MSTALTRAARRVDDRRRAIEALILVDMELALLRDPAPRTELETDRHDAGVAADAISHNASPYRVVTWQV